MNISAISEVYNMDCVAGMREYPDNYFDLAICDPPYGIDMDGGQIGVNGSAKAKKYDKKDWDKSPPNIEFFMELLRVSKNQIIWGANHFIDLMPYRSPCWIVWDKKKVGGFYADCELAWTSFDTAVRKFDFAWHGFIQGDMKNKEIRLHPTQKPVKLYEWLLKNYAQTGDKIIDTHLGSGSSRIAAQKLGFDFYGFEIDQDYFEQSEKRFKDAVSMPLFDVPVFVPQQLVLV
jgi:site-specific DNA-methyltransferase (adenine-specific)